MTGLSEEKFLSRNRQIGTLQCLKPAKSAAGLVVFVFGTGHLSSILYVKQVPIADMIFTGNLPRRLLKNITKLFHNVRIKP